ncbi:MAG: SRPBCC domain-containing protein [Pseudomonadota bacterium]
MTPPQTAADLVVERMIDAPRERVWTAWTEPKLLRAWFYPEGCRMENPQFDVRPGGSYACDYHADGGTVHRVRGVFETLDQPELIVMTHGWADEAGVVEHDTRVTVTFADLGARTHITVRQVGLPTEDARSSHDEGWRSALEHLARCVAATD